jgi:hypothetical protein
MGRGLFDVDLEQQVADLRKEMSALSSAVAKHGGNFYEEAGDSVSAFLSQLANRVGPSIGGLRRQARTVERAAFDHPAVVATVGLVMIGLVASLVLRSRSASEPTRRPRRQAAKAEPERAKPATQRRSRGRNSSATAH